MIDYVQTGDVIFFPLGYRNTVEPIAEEIPKDAKKRKSLVVQEGRTGNTHALRGEGTTIWDHGGKVFVDVKEIAYATHGEHTDKPLLRGRYEVRNVMEENVFSGMRAAVVD
jgi:hypothetical protein